MNNIDRIETSGIIEKVFISFWWAHDGVYLNGDCAKYVNQFRAFSF